MSFDKDCHLELLLPGLLGLLGLLFSIQLKQILFELEQQHVATDAITFVEVKSVKQTKMTLLAQQLHLRK